MAVWGRGKPGDDGPTWARPSAGAHATTLEGLLEAVTYVNEENAWSVVVRLAVPGKRDLVTVVGNLLGVQPGENLRLRGQWKVDRKYGEQFKADGYVTVQPATLVGIEKYLGSGMVRGLGKVMARRIVAHFGLSTLEVIGQGPYPSQSDALRARPPRCCRGGHGSWSRRRATCARSRAGHSVRGRSSPWRGSIPAPPARGDRESSGKPWRRSQR